jgi:flagellar biosynthetic protein FliO
MQRISSRWWSVIVAVLVVGGLAVYVAAGNARVTPPQSAPAATAAGAAPGVLTAPKAVPTQSADPLHNTGQSTPVIDGGTLVDLLIKVGIVGALLAGSLWALKKFTGGATRSAGRADAIRVLDTLPLAQNRALYVIDVGDRAVVVGATPQQFAFLADVTDAATLERLRVREGAPVASGIANSIGALLGRAQSAKRPSPGSAEGGFVADAPGVWSTSADEAEQAARLRATAARLRAGGES